VTTNNDLGVMAIVIDRIVMIMAVVSIMMIVMAMTTNAKFTNFTGGFNSPIIFAIDGISKCHKKLFNAHYGSPLNDLLSHYTKSGRRV